MHISAVRRFLLHVCIFALLFALLPLFALRSCNGHATDKQPPLHTNSSTNTSGEDYFTIYDEASAQTLVVPDSEFLYGAVVCEMPLTYCDEALKAQAVAAYTVYDYKRAQRRANGTSGADFICNTDAWYLYTTDVHMQTRWGNDYGTYRARLTQILDGLSGVRLTYNSTRVLSTYYAISGGVTEASADIWGGALAYLVPVDSAWDANAADYVTNVTVSAEEFCHMLLQENPNCIFSTEKTEWIGAVQRTASGTVQEITLGGQTFRGETVRLLFGLRSSNFTLTVQNNALHFSVRGYGHGVGMSQYGANCMAASGADFATILSHYYPGTTLFFP